MTTSVISVDEQTPYREVAEVLIHNRVSAVPVVSRSGEVVGVVSEADLALKVEAAGEPLRRLRLTRRRRSEQRKAGGRTAADLMTSPAVVVARSLSLAAAARRMDRAGVGACRWSTRRVSWRAS
jgi:CBS domain-containing protein